MANLESRVAALEDKLAVLDGYGLIEYAEAVRNGMAAMGWNRFPSVADLSPACLAGVSEMTLLAHFRRILSKYPSPSAAYNDGHGANLRIDKSLIPFLLDGRGIGYTPWSATEDEQRALFGYTQADLDALSAKHPEKLILDFHRFVATNGAEGWRPRAGDPRGASSDDLLYGGRQ